MPDEAEQQMELQRKEQQQVPGWVRRMTEDRDGDSENRQS